MHAANSVAVVVPAFNASRWIGETLASVGAQTVNPASLEVIVVDDGSTDDTAERARTVLASLPFRSRVLCQANAGPSRARNLGWASCESEWIEFLDADDLLHPEKLARQIDTGMRAGPEAAVVYCPWQAFGTIDTRWEQPRRVARPRLEGDTVTALLDGGNAVPTGAQLFRRSWLERVGGWDERWRNGEDHDLYFRVAFAGGRFVCADADEPLFFYRRHPPAVGSLSNRSGRVNAETWLRVAADVEERSRALGDLPPERAARIAHLYAGCAKWLAEFDWRAARPWLDRLERLHPGYVPDWSGRLRLLSRLTGYRRAVWLAARLRRLRGPADPSPHLVEVAPPLRGSPASASAT